MAPRSRRPKVPDRRPNQNMGKVQVAEAHWRDYGASNEQESNYLRGPEWADRQEREAYGRPLPAGYRYIIGPAPKLLAGDLVGARTYLRKIETAVQQGGWTRSEWTRLRRLRAKWKERATGNDPRFKEIGNKRTGLNQMQTANIRTRKMMADITKKLEQALASRGD